jgi:hypothetical protein
MQLKPILHVPVNELVFDWMSELSLIKYTNYPHPDFLVDVKASLTMNGEMDELIKLINANVDSPYSTQEIHNCTYVHITYGNSHV